MSVQYPQIPLPTPTVDGLTTSVMALKQAVDTLTSNGGAGAVRKASYDTNAYEISTYIQTINATISTVGQISEDQGALLADLVTTVDAYGATITEHTTAIGDINGELTGKWSVSVDIDGKVTGVELIETSSGTSSFDVRADKFNVWATGYSNTPVFSISTIGGVAGITIDGNFLGDLSVLNNGLANNAATNGSASTGQAAGSNTSGTASVTVRAGSRIVITATYAGGAAASLINYLSGQIDVTYTDPSSTVVTQSFIVGGYWSAASHVEIWDGTSVVIQIGGAAAGTWQVYAHSYVPTLGDFTSSPTTVTIQEYSK